MYGWGAIEKQQIDVHKVMRGRYVNGEEMHKGSAIYE